MMNHETSERYYNSMANSCNLHGQNRDRSYRYDTQRQKNTTNRDFKTTERSKNGASPDESVPVRHLTYVQYRVPISTQTADCRRAIRNRMTMAAQKLRNSAQTADRRTSWAGIPMPLLFGWRNSLPAGLFLFLHCEPRSSGVDKRGGLCTQLSPARAVRSSWIFEEFIDVYLFDILRLPRVLPPNADCPTEVPRSIWRALAGAGMRFYDFPTIPMERYTLLQTV